MRKSAFCICKNKGADQLHGNRAADQRPCFPYMGIKTLLLSKSKISRLSSISIFCSCTAKFALDLVGNLKNRFSHDTALFKIIIPE